jgi:hypothetical protein
MPFIKKCNYRAKIDFRKFLDNFLQNARNEIFTAISVVLVFYVSIFQFFDNHINPSKI